jgi:hypothetical protein
MHTHVLKLESKPFQRKFTVKDYVHLAQPAWVRMYKNLVFKVNVGRYKSK